MENQNIKNENLADNVEFFIAKCIKSNKMNTLQKSKLIPFFWESWCTNKNDVNNKVEDKEIHYKDLIILNSNKE